MSRVDDPALDAFFAGIGPFLEGRASVEDARRALYGNAASVDAERLAIYGRFCRGHRRAALDGVYTAVRALVTRHAGEPAWAALVEGYFRAHPMHHAELNENGDAFAAFLADRADLPAWTAALADLEWWEWRTRVAPDDPADVDPGGPLRLASTVELRPYTRDLVGWLDDTDRRGVPMASPTYVLFWRDPALEPRRERATRDELRVLQAVSAGISVPDALADTLADLREAGIVLG